MRVSYERILIKVNNHETQKIASFSQKNHQILSCRIQNIRKNSFETHFHDFKYFHHYWEGDIVVLVGNSGAGKSSIIKSLIELESDRLEDGGDLRCDLAIVKYFKTQYPFEFSILQHSMRTTIDISKAIFTEERGWKTPISLPEIYQAEKMIQKIRKRNNSLTIEEHEKRQTLFQYLELEMFDETFVHSRKGRNIVFDVLNIDTFFKHKLMRNFNGPLRVALIYCPLRYLSDRMEKRNKEAEESGQFSNQRIGAFPLLQFSDLYAKKEMDQQTLEKLNRKHVIETFDKNFNDEIENARFEGEPLPSEKIIALDKKKLRNKYLSALGFEEGIEIIEIAPKKLENYDLILNSYELSAEDSANIIHQGTFERYKTNNYNLF